VALIDNGWGGLSNRS